MICDCVFRWKEAKSRLISAIKVASKNVDASRLAMLKPDNIKTAEEWKDFTKEKLSEEFELKSKKYKHIRAKNTIPHTMSRKGYARLAEELATTWSLLSCKHYSSCTNGSICYYFRSAMLNE